MLQACFHGVDDTGTVIFTALNFLTVGAAKAAFDFTQLVKDTGAQAKDTIGKTAAAMKKPEGGGGGGGGGHGYYKAQTPPPIQKQGSGYYKARTPGGSPGGGDYFNANTAGGPTAPRYTGASAKDLKALGREPKLNDRQEDTGAPDAPQPVTVNQSTTQDLSLPEDEFSYKANQPNKAGRSAARTMTRMIKAPLNSVGGMAGLRF